MRRRREKVAQPQLNKKILKNFNKERGKFVMTRDFLNEDGLRKSLMSTEKREVVELYLQLRFDHADEIKQLNAKITKLQTELEKKNESKRTFTM